MGSETGKLEERLKSLLVQLHTEYGILDRIVYKGKNQHRHGFYFQYLLKVRRDLRLLKSTGLEDILNFLFQAIEGKKPDGMFYLLERLKKKKNYSAKHNFQERLLGVARFLSEMVEPIMKAAIQISTLLARSFFTEFSLAVLAVLARVRVLTQQILLDVVSVFNMVSSLSQKQQSIKLTKAGMEVFREYFPPKGIIITLECIWDDDKFVLQEKSVRSEEDQATSEGKAFPVETSSIQYDRLHFSTDDAPFEQDVSQYLEEKDHGDKILPEFSTKAQCGSADFRTSGISEDCPMQFSDCRNEGSANFGSPIAETAAVGGINPEVAGHPSPTSPKPPVESSKLSFISVRKAAQIASPGSPSHKRARPSHPMGTSNLEEDSLYALFTGENKKESLF